MVRDITPTGYSPVVRNSTPTRYSPVVRDVTPTGYSPVVGNNRPTRYSPVVRSGGLRRRGGRGSRLPPVVDEPRGPAALERRPGRHNAERRILHPRRRARSARAAAFALCARPGPRPASPRRRSPAARRLLRRPRGLARRGQRVCLRRSTRISTAEYGTGIRAGRVDGDLGAARRNIRINSPVTQGRLSWPRSPTARRFNRGRNDSGRHRSGVRAATPRVAEPQDPPQQQSINTIAQVSRNRLLVLLGPVARRFTRGRDDGGLHRRGVRAAAPRCCGAPGSSPAASLHPRCPRSPAGHSSRPEALPQPGENRPL